MYITDMNMEFRPLKSLGQCFLIDSNIPKKIVRLSGINRTCGVLEVGPGLGALTEQLAGTAGHVTAVELDRRLIAKLCQMLKTYPNVTIVHGDILKTDLCKLACETLPEARLHICANLPYNITTSAITLFLEAKVFETATVMVQREVAKRICASPGSAEYGAFSLFVAYYSHPKILFSIPPECFNPRPRVTSSVVKMDLCRERILCDEAERMLFRIVRAAFAQRRKTLVNALSAAFSGTHSKKEIVKTIEECGHNARIRGEMLGLDEFIQLAVALQQNIDNNT